MKKTIAFLVLLTLVFTLCACGQATDDVTDVSAIGVGGTDTSLYYEANTSAWVDAVNTSLAGNYNWTEYEASELLSLTGEVLNNTSNYTDKLFAFSGLFASQGGYYYITGMDYVNNCCQWNMELLFNDATELPESDAGVVLVGKFGSYVDSADNKSYPCLYVEQIASSEEAKAKSDTASYSADSYAPVGSTYTLQDGRVVTVTSAGNFGKGLSAVVSTVDLSEISYNYSAIENQYMPSNMTNLQTYPGNFYGKMMCFKGTYRLADGVSSVTGADADGSNAWQMELLFNDATPLPADGTVLSLVGTYGSYAAADGSNRYAVCVEQYKVEAAAD